MLLHDLYDWHATHHRDDEVARDCGGRSVTWAQMLGTADHLASAMRASGIEPGDRIAVLAKNCLEYPSLYLAASKAGVALVPLNYRLAPAEWRDIVADAGARLVFIGPGFEDAAADTIGNVTTVALATLDQWLAPHPSAPPALDADPDAIVVQMYTSGTTGLPKGVLLTHRTLIASMLQIMLVTPHAAALRLQVVAPMYHIGATITTLVALAGRGSLHVHEDFVPDEVVRVLDEEGIGQTFLVPAMIQALLVFVPDVAERAYKELRFIGYGASPISEDTLRQAIEVFGCSFSQGFGQTEATSMITYLSPQDHERALCEDKPELLRSCGRAAPATDLRVVDEDGSELPPYETGEIVARGPQVMQGYWNLPDATAETVVDGWLHTGDAGYLDEDGYLYVQDRVKDMIVSGGENIYPAEIEQVLFQHPAVSDAAVIGIPDDRWGEAVHAVVQLRPDGKATQDELIAHCRDRLAGYKRPRSVELVDEIPRNASMKVLKRVLREPFWRGHQRAVH